MQIVKNMVAAVVVTVVCLTLWSVAIEALDRSIFSGCRVIETRGQQMVIRLDKDLCTGTDSACEEAEHVIKKIRKAGYDPYLLVYDGEWVPTVAPFVYGGDE